MAQMRTRRRFLAAVAAVAGTPLAGILWYMFTVPGQIQNAQTWLSWIDKLGSAVMLGVILTSVFLLTCLVYALTPGRFRFWERSRVPTTIDPDQSDVYYIGAKLLTVTVFVSIENQLDTDVQLKYVDLVTVTSGSRLEARNVAFDEAGTEEEAVDVDRVCIPARKIRTGWFIFTCDENIRPVEFKHFEMQVQAVGEPLETHRFEPYAWDDLKKGNSRIVLLSPRWWW